VSGATVLVVEGEQATADRIRRTLSRLGYTAPETAATGEDGVRRAEKLRPQLVLVDIKLDGPMDGVAAASEINARFGIPIVYLTTHGDDAALARATASKPHGYLVTPFSDQDVRTSVEVALFKHELESRLRLRERWFETTLRSIGDAVIAINAQGTVTFMNPVAETLTGYGPDALGKKIDEVFRLVDPAGSHVDNPVWIALSKTFTVELPDNTSLLDRSGSRLPIDDSMAPIVDDEGAVVGGVIVFRDVTDRKKLEQRLAQTERLASIGTMVAGMGHEINNPLSYAVANVSFSEELLSEVLEKLRCVKGEPADRVHLDWGIGRLEEIGRALHDASDGNERVRRIVDDLRKFARADAGPMEAIDLPDVIEAAIKMTASTIRHHARLQKEYGTTPLVEGHPGQLTQVFTNLIVNAAQSIGEGRAETNEIRVQTRTDAGGRAVVEVRDTGPGIPSDVLPHIFDAFFTTKPVGGGTGLGLAICQNLVASCGGEITAASPPGEGAVFCVTLPPARGSSSRQRAASRASMLPSRRGRVLVIDDERAIAAAIARMLQGAHDVVIEIDARRALARIARGETYDVIFCDLMMPNLSGMDLYNALASSAPEMAKRIVFLTGGAFSASSQAFLDGVANTALDKPFTVESIRTIASDYIR
jgi:two-component system, cell cycle sensor histidine kinase and response regulator CckA